MSISGDWYNEIGSHMRSLPTRPATSGAPTSRSPDTPWARTRWSDAMSRLPSRTMAPHWAGRWPGATDGPTQAR